MSGKERCKRDMRRAVRGMERCEEDMRRVVRGVVWGKEKCGGGCEVGCEWVARMMVKGLRGVSMKTRIAREALETREENVPIRQR